MASSQNFDLQFADFTKHVLSLENHVRAMSPAAKNEPATEAVMEELLTSLEELNVAQEELYQQQSELIDARARAEEERARYQDLFQFAPDAYFVTDMNGMVQEVNRAGAVLFGVAQHYLIGKPLAVYIAKENIPEFRRQLQDIAYQVGVLSWDTQIIPRRASPIDISINMAVMRDEKNKPTALRWLLRDISQRKQMEERVRKMNQELEVRVKERTAALNAALLREQEARILAQEANATKLRFLAMVSHELRTPLASIVGFASTLMSEDVNWSKSEQHRFLEIINQEADKLTELIAQILDVSRLESGTLRVQLEAQPFNAMLNSIRPQLEQIIEPHHQLAIIVPEDLPIMNMDAPRVAQVILNLVDNAIKYSPESTTITLMAERKDNMLQVCIRDKGYGIEPAKRDIIFQPFQQVENKEMYFQKGVGLGLAICKGIVEMHGGEIWIETVDGETGTSFCFTLPFAAASV